ncbi:MAG: rod shape-determining protein MreD [Oscillospiraceae bacterium]|jgi:rod shape-determining protein MreD|nr:rod shape-determining protein MreD [Oscillospiraceae bacterium]
MPLSKNQRKLYLRRVILAVFVVFTAMAQNVPWLPAIFGIRALPLIPLVVTIAVLDTEPAAIGAGFFAGVFWDLSANAHGLHAIFCTCTAFAVAMLMRYLLNRNRIAVFLLSACAVAFYLFAHWMTAHVFSGHDLPIYLFVRYYLPSFVYTILFLPIDYLLVNAVVRRTSRRKGGVLAQ